MAERRDFMGYIGTGAIGSIVGYYVGAQKLLGIQSEDVVVERDPDQSTEEPPEDTPTEEPPEDTPTEEPPEDTPTEDPPEDTPTEEPPEDTPADMDLPPLAARYTFENSGSTIEDVTGNGHDGELQNASRATGYDGQSLKFEETNQEFATFGGADELNPRNGSIAVEYWFKSTSDDNKNELVTKRGGNNVFLRTLLRNGRVRFMLKDTNAISAGSSAINTQDTYNDGEWHHVIAFRDTENEQLRLWVDGTEYNETDEEGDINPSGSWLAGGNPRYPNPHYTEGMIDNLRIYKSESTELATFETGSLNSWENVDNAKITDQESFSGNQSVVITDRNEDGGIGNSIYRPVDSITPNQLSGAFRVSDGATPTVIIRWRDNQQNPVHTIRMSIPRNNIQYPGQQGRRPFYEGVETSNWYHIVLNNLDWKAGVVSEIKVNGEVVLEEDIQFPRISNPITSVQLRCHSGGTGTTGYFDDVTIG